MVSESIIIKPKNKRGGNNNQENIRIHSSGGETNVYFFTVCLYGHDCCLNFYYLVLPDNKNKTILTTIESFLLSDVK